MFNRLLFRVAVGENMGVLVNAVNGHLAICSQTQIFSKVHDFQDLQEFSKHSER